MFNDLNYHIANLSFNPRCVPHFYWVTNQAWTMNCNNPLLKLEGRFVQLVALKITSRDRKAAMEGDVVTRNKKRVVIGGSHGKTSTTAMILHVLNYVHLECDYLVGAQLEGFDTMVKLTHDAPSTSTLPN